MRNQIGLWFKTQHSTVLAAASGCILCESGDKNIVHPLSLFFPDRVVPQRDRDTTACSCALFMASELSTTSLRLRLYSCWAWTRRDQLEIAASPPRQTCYSTTWPVRFVKGLLSLLLDRDASRNICRGTFHAGLSRIHRMPWVALIFFVGRWALVRGSSGSGTGPNINVKLKQ